MTEYCSAESGAEAFFLRKKEIKYTLIILLVTLIPRAVLAFCSIPLRTPLDEFSTMFFGSHLGGNNWSEVETYAHYYGFGMSLFTWWIYKLPVGIVYKYKLLLFFCGLLQALVGIVSYRIIRVYTDISKPEQVILAILCSYMVVTRNTVFFNEHAMILISWILTYLFARLVSLHRAGEKIYHCLICIMIVLSLACIIHTRAITYVAAFCITVLLYMYLENNWSIRLIFSFVGIVVIYMAIKKSVVPLYISCYFKNVQGDVANSVISVPKLTITNAFGTLLAFIGQVGTVFMTSMGVLLIGMVGILGSFFRRITNRKEELSPLLYGQILMLTCILITIVYNGMTWRGCEYIRRWMNGDVENNYDYKIFTYIRYMGPYVGPVFLGGLIELRKRHSKKWFIILISIFAIAVVLWFYLIYPYVINNRNCNEAFMCFALETPFATGGLQYKLGFTFSFIGLLLLLFFSGKRKLIALYALVFCFLMYQYCMNAVNYDQRITVMQYEKVNGTVELIKKLEENGIEIDLPVYAVNSVMTEDHPFFFTLQVYLEKKTVKPALDGEIPENALIITNDLDVFQSNYALEGFSEYYLDDDEALLTRNEDVIHYITNNEIAFEAGKKTE